MYPTANHFDVNDEPTLDAKALEQVTAHKYVPPITAQGCPYCADAGLVVFTRNSVKYGREYGKWPWCYICVQCDAYVGCHPGTVIPLGTLANQATANARKAAHAAFDPLWKDGPFTRKEAYKYLSEQLKIAREDCHISWFDISTCEKVVAIAKKHGARVEKPTLAHKFKDWFR